MSVQSQTKNASEWLLGAWKKNPEGILLLAAGCALLLRSGSSPLAAAASSLAADGRESESGRVGRMTEGAKNYTRDAAQYASDIAEQTGQAAQSYASTAADYAGQAKRAIGEQSERVFEQARSTAQSTLSTAQSTLDRVIQEQPLLVAMAGLAAGAAVAATFRTTEIEKQTLGPIGEQVTEAAQRVGEQVKDAAAEAGGKLKEAAEQRGLTPDGMKEMAKEVAGAFSSSISGTASQSPAGSAETGAKRWPNERSS
jgi:hypothetical protein